MELLSASCLFVFFWGKGILLILAFRGRWGWGEGAASIFFSWVPHVNIPFLSMYSRFGNPHHRKWQDSFLPPVIALWFLLKKSSFKCSDFNSFFPHFFFTKVSFAVFFILRRWVRWSESAFEFMSNRNHKMMRPQSLIKNQTPLKFCVCQFRFVKWAAML